MAVKDKQSKKIMAMDIGGEIIYKGRITDYPIDDALIVNKSILFFNDASPCFFHRSAVMKRLYYELEEYFSKEFSRGVDTHRWERLPENIREILAGKGQIHTVVYME